MKHRIAAAAVLLVTAVPPAAVADHADGSYAQPVIFRWDRAVIDVVVVPPAHGQLLNANGVLGGGDAAELDAFRSSYLRAIEDGVADWRRAVAEHGPAWLAEGLEITLAVAGRDPLPAEPEVVITALETVGDPYATSYVGNPCVVANGMFFVRSMTPEDMFNINAQEVGHCLGIAHVAGDAPATAHDLMAVRYVHQAGSGTAERHCVSNLNVLGLEVVFAGALGRPEPPPAAPELSAAAYHRSGAC